MTEVGLLEALEDLGVQLEAAKQRQHAAERDLATLRQRHAELLASIDKMSQRHAEAVEAAFREGWLERGLLPDCGMPPLNSCSAAWLASEAKARLT